MDFPGIEHVEYLEPHKHIEHVCEMSARTPTFYFLFFFIEFLHIPVIRSSRINIRSIWTLILNNRFRKPVLSSKNNSIYHNHLVNSIAQNMFHHLR